MLLRRFLDTIAVLSWDILAMTTAVCNCRIESLVAKSSIYVQIALEYRKSALAGTADITISEA